MDLKEYFDSIPATLDAIIQDGLHDEICDYKTETSNESKLNDLLFKLEDAFNDKWKMLMSVGVDPSSLYKKLIKDCEYLFLVNRPNAYRKLMDLINNLIDHINDGLNY